MAIAGSGPPSDCVHSSCEPKSHSPT
ncbi:uncharacterized protein G2W53_012942 [Senna tora]|uniref:Uncharacterized protein n=1 Tax=Senna tora TaxID=362788 RepID=A0A834U462_9FABA|nr:uncharacterized protein G2W53_012942 [Senna tora]